MLLEYDVVQIYIEQISHLGLYLWKPEEFITQHFHKIWHRTESS